MLPEYYCYFAGLADKIERRRDPGAAARDPQLHAARAARRGRRDHPWNSPLLLTVDEARAGAGRRQHDRDQAVGAHLGVAARADAAGRGGRLPAGRRQRRHRLRRRRGRRAGRRTPDVAKIAFTGSSRDRPRGSPRRPARRLARVHARAGRQVAAAWCSPTPTRRAPRWASSPACSPPPARPAWRARACSCRRASTTRCSSGCWSARGGSGSAIRSTPTPSSARWRCSDQLEKVESYVGDRPRRPTARRCCTAAGSRISRPPPAAGSTSRPSSPTRATTCGSARRRSSARSR